MSEVADRIIAIADAAYPDGLVKQWYEDPDGRHGDTLAEFIASELSDDSMGYEDDFAAGVRVAAEAMAVAVRELQAVQDALECAAIEAAFKAERGAR